MLISLERRQQYWKTGYRNRLLKFPNYLKDMYLKERKHRLEYAQERRNKLKVEVLTHYSGGMLRCVSCGESRPVCLSIDHINGGGTKHIAKIGGGSAFYAWLRHNGYPNGYQTLCMNCQYVKRELNHEVRGKAEQYVKHETSHDASNT